MNKQSFFNALIGFAAWSVLAGCTSLSNHQGPLTSDNALAKDRAAILAMAGDYEVTFDFTETVALKQGYDLKKPYVTHAQEVVRVIEDRPGFISLQHILLVGGDEKIPLKHWRQDWIYQPGFVNSFVGFNGWKKVKLDSEDMTGKWAQVVYQVDDGLRYSGVAAWRHENGYSSWTSNKSLRPIPRRDMTKRDDYDAILATNRHAITPTGWVHEQENEKLIIRDGVRQVLVKEVGVNTYTKSSSLQIDVAERYWQKTAEYWRAVRTMWSTLQMDEQYFGLTMQGEPVALYMPLLEYANQLIEQKTSLEDAIERARKTIDKFTTTKRIDGQTLVNNRPFVRYE